MAMWKYLKHFDEKIFENIFFEILSLPYFQKFSHSKISTFTVSNLQRTYYCYSHTRSLKEVVKEVTEVRGAT